MKSRIVIVTGRGGPEVLRVTTREAPTPRARQVRIRVVVAGVAFGDVMRRRGVLAPPWSFTPGYDVVGTVDALGPGIDGVEVGTRVAYLMPGPGFGGYAEHVCAPVDQLVPVPDEIEPATAVALGLNYITAYQLVHRTVPLGAGQRALIHGAAGGVGTAISEVGALAGVTLYGTASAGKHDVVRARGVTPIDYRSEDFVARMSELAPDGVDAVFDSIGGNHLLRSHACLAPGGTLVTFGVSGDLAKGMRGVIAGLGTYVRLKLRWDGRRLRTYGITMSPGASRRECREDWERVLTMHREGALTPLVGARVPFEDVAEAHALLDGSRVSGKVVLELG